MEGYTPISLICRNDIIQSQKLFINYLNDTVVNKLLYLFDKNICGTLNPNEKIIKYIKQERHIRGLNDKYVTIDSYYYDHDKENTTLQIMIKKYCNDFLHFTIHLVPNSFKPNDAGLLHFYKDAYSKNNKIIRRNKYAVLIVKNILNKNNSLCFSIANGYETPGINKLSLTEIELKQEMDVIITIMNRIFDEDNSEYFIGRKNPNNQNIKMGDSIEEISLNNINSYTGKNINTIQNTIQNKRFNKIYPAHPNVNIVLKNINRKPNHITRKNYGSVMMPIFVNKNISKKIKYPYTKLIGKRLNRITRKKK